ncbi:delta-class carbonic anhydrase [Albimonas sp. CAU 1670]|uniref:delta-class carbonic anhydrase n=1 Tax=Albimonas sp. CAU 1670 TaxID=3032599 RepID=UPI0023DA9FC7|nr:delta-class carbonic anhydrase [Albimonas sp. CAU 1670]MDF2232815.1 delta-class carbonic anhydrase [Albimonas sp. CAU 1670]
MIRSAVLLLSALAAAAPVASARAGADPLCEGFGPQTPRDISAKAGANARLFALAPPASRMNLCNIHFHVNAEHKGPGFSVPGGPGEHGGWRCNETAALTAEELDDPLRGHGACGGLKPGDTVEVHWVHTTCDAGPGAGLGACATETCANPQLRVETQVFLAVNDPEALDFSAFDYASSVEPAGLALSQPRALPTGFGEPVVFAGSTTGPAYSDASCSPYQVTWSVRPWCARVDVMTLHRWCAENAFEEDHAHGVRRLVTAPALLAPIE